MSPALPARRRAERLHRLIEATASTGGAERRPDGELDRLAELANGLRALPPVEPGAAFSADLRERLMAAAVVELAPARTAKAAVEDRLTVRRRSGQGRRQRRMTVGIATLAIVGGTAGTAFASNDALPGDTLYPVKRAIENVQTGFTVGDQSKGTALLSEADTRLSEVRALTRRSGPVDTGAVRGTLETFASQATQASDLLLNYYKKHQSRTTIQRLRDFTGQGIDQLAEVEAAIPPEAQPALADATNTLLLIDQAARALCPDCGGQGITQIPSSLLESVAQTVTGLIPPGHTGPTPLPGKQPGKQTEAGPAEKHPIMLPSVDADHLLPGTVDPSAQPSPTAGTSTQQGGTSPSGSSGSTSDGGTSAQQGDGQKQADPSPSPSTAGGAVGGAVGGVVGGTVGTVGGVVDGVGDTLDGVIGTVGGLLGGSGG